MPPDSSVDRTLELRAGPVAALIRDARLIVILRRITPQRRLLDLVDAAAASGALVFEITFDGPTAATDLLAARRALDRRLPRFAIGAGTLRSVAQVHEAKSAHADFGAAPVLDLEVLGAAIAAGLPFMPGAMTPTEIDRAWRDGATFVKLFPGSSIGPSHLRELRAPVPEPELVVTGGLDVERAMEFLRAGATAVGLGSAITSADEAERRSIVSALAGR